MMEPLPRPHKHVWQHCGGAYSPRYACTICLAHAGVIRRAVWGLLGVRWTR